ncbi:hypothetical protein O9992_20175 [Vibrio lentus]|nr:hypothetical protein [Vibrio lentus]
MPTTRRVSRLRSLGAIAILKRIQTSNTATFAGDFSRRRNYVRGANLFDVEKTAPVSAHHRRWPSWRVGI